jgi:hypothetical protein
VGVVAGLVLATPLVLIRAQLSWVAGNKLGDDACGVIQNDRKPL